MTCQEKNSCQGLHTMGLLPLVIMSVWETESHTDDHAPELASERQVGSSWALAVSDRWPPLKIWVPRRPPRRLLLPPDLVMLCRAAAQALSPAPSPVDKLSQGGDISLYPHCYQAGCEKCLHGEQLCFSIQSSNGSHCP